MSELHLITHADKVFFAERGETKGDLAEHYLRVAGPLLRAMGGRPVLLQRFPDGASGPSFFQKRVPKNAPDWLQTTVVSTPNGTTSQALVAADIDHVLWAVNLGCLGFHVWPYLADAPEHTDELRIDLDPSPGVEFSHIRQAAHEVHGLLTELGITGYAKTTGNRGVHVYVRLQPRWGLLPGARRRRGAGPGAGAPQAGPGDRRLVEGGRDSGVFIDFDQNAPPRRCWRMRRCAPAGRAGVHAAGLGGDRRHPPRSVHHRHPASQAGVGRRPMAADER